MMKDLRISLAIACLLLANMAIANECSITVDSTDSMQFDTKNISVNKACKDFTVTLTHSGKLPKNVMGHNWVLSKTADARAAAADGARSGLANHYVKPGDTRVIAFTEIIGGGEKTAVTFSVSKLKAGEEYTFFCSFPGHIGLMIGTLTLA